MNEEIENNSEATTEPTAEAAPPKKKPSPIGRVLFLVLTALCFAYLYSRLDGAAGREGLSLVEYMTQVFATVDWIPWLALMVCYSLFYFAIDTLVVTKALNWFVADIKYKDIMPIRASAYIISIFNEQIGKGLLPEQAR
jgi:hypothetical protein